MCIGLGMRAVNPTRLEGCFAGLLWGLLENVMRRQCKADQISRVGATAIADRIGIRQAVARWTNRRALLSFPSAGMGNGGLTSADLVIR